MEQAVTLFKLPEDIENHIKLQCSIESIGRLGAVSKAYNYWYQNVMFCKPNVINCSSIGCSFFPKINDSAFDACTDCLVFYARRYKEEKKEEDKQRFEHLLRHHEEKRMNTVIWNKTKPSVSDVLDIYAKNYLDCKQTKIFRKIVSRYVDNLSCWAIDGQVFATKMLFNKDVENLTDIGVRAEQKLLEAIGKCDDTQVIRKIVDCFDYRYVLNGVMRMFVHQNKNIFVTTLIEKYGEEALYQAVDVAIKQEKDILPIALIKQHKDVIKKRKFDLYRLALRNNYRDVEILSLLFSDDVQAVDSDTDSLLHLAAYYGNEDCIRFLLKKGVNINAVNNQDRTALEVFLRNGYSERSFVNITKMFVEYGANINKIDIFGKSLMKNRYNVGIGDQQLQELRKAICFLIDSGININMVDDNGMTILHYYAKYGCCDIIEKLIEKKLDIHAVDKVGRTVLHYACQWRYRNIEFIYNTIKILLKAGIGINACDNNGNTPLLTAAQLTKYSGNSIYLINFLLDNEADVSLMNQKKQGVLHCISRSNCLSLFDRGHDFKILCKRLFEAGADSESYDNDGNTPLNIQYIRELLQHKKILNSPKTILSYFKKEQSNGEKSEKRKDVPVISAIAKVWYILNNSPIFLGVFIGISTVGLLVSVVGLALYLNKFF
jgi:ankyrin repeat protein